MSGLLHRLVGQSVTSGGATAAASRIRPAARMHAQAPTWTTRENLQSSPPLQTFAPSANAEHASIAINALSGDVMQPQAGPSLRPELLGFVVRSSPTEPDARTPLSYPAVARDPASLESPIGPTAREFDNRAPKPLFADVSAQPAASSTIRPITLPRIVAQAEQTRVSAEPNEVHVHIGRIEVTAVQESAPHKTVRGSAARNTLPLNEYLARKRRT